MDLSKVPTEDLLAYKQGRLQDVSTETLLALKGMQRAQQSPPQTFSQRLEADWQKRQAKIDQAAQLGAKGKMSPEAVGFVSGANRVGYYFGDVPGEVAKSTIQALPQGIKDTASNVGNFVYSGLSSGPLVGPALRGAGGVLSQAAQGYNKFKQNNPELGLLTDAAIDVGTGAAWVAPLPKGSGSTITPATAVLGAPKTAVKTAFPTKYAPDISSDAVRKMGGQLIDKASKTGAVIKPEAAASFIDDITTKIKPRGQWASAAKVRTEVDDIVENMAALKGQPMGLDDAMELESVLGKAAYSPKNYQMGKFTPEGLQIKKIQESLADMIDNAANAGLVSGDQTAVANWREGQKYWAASVRARELENIIENAQNFDHPATAIRVGMRNIIKNKSKFNKYTPNQQKLIKEAAKTGIVTDALRLGGSGLGPIISGTLGAGAGLVAGGPVGAAIGAAAAAGPSYAIREASKNIATARQMARANKAYETIAAESVGLPTKKLTVKEIMALPPKQAEMYLKNVNKTP